VYSHHVEKVYADAYDYFLFAGLAVDFDLELIYIIDGFTHKLLVCGLDGSNLRTMLSDSSMIRHPFSLSLLKVVLLEAVSN